MTRLARIPRAVLVGAFSLLTATGVLLAEPLRLTRNIPGDSKPIVLHADQIITWTDGGQRIILLRGKVMVEHGVFLSRAAEAVVRIDEERLRKTRVLHADLYADGDVFVENGDRGQHVEQTLIELNTRGELKLKAQASKIIQASRVDDPLYQRAVMGAKWPVSQPPPAPPAATRVPAGQPAPSGLQQTSYETPASPMGRPQPVVPAQYNPDPMGSGSTNPMNPMSPGTLPPSTPPPGPIVPPPRADDSRTPGRARGGQARAGLPMVPRAPADGPPRNISIRPRTQTDFQAVTVPLSNGEQALVVTGGVSVTVSNVQNFGLVDIEADRMVFWSRGNVQEMLSGMRTTQGKATRELEFYLAGHVEIRQKTAKDNRLFKAEEIYYDVGRNVAVGVSGDLEIHQKGIPDPIHMKADEIMQLSPTLFQASRAEVSSSKLPSDPGLKILVERGTLEEKKVERRSIFGLTGRAEEEQLLFRGENAVVKLEDVPVAWFPWVQGDAKDPLGPLEQIHFGGDRVFGARIGVSLDVYDLLGLEPVPNTRWRFDVDYLSKRGPALGSVFDYHGKDLFSIPSFYTGFVKLYGIYDTGTDILGGGRGENEHHTPWRGRATWQQDWRGSEGFTVQTQGDFLSDKNFFEQYYKQEFDNGINQETFLYVKQQQENWAWTAIAEPNIRTWVTETQWLPRVDGYLLAQSFFDLVTYNTHASAAYAQLHVTTVPPPPVVSTDVPITTGRFDWWHELSLPFYLGPFKVVPYGIVDVTYYTEDLTTSDQGRLYGAAGVRSTIPFSKLFPEIHNELFNVNGIFHKITFGTNYYVAHSDVPYSQLPQLDRLDDDATDQARRDITPQQPTLNPAHGVALMTDPLFNLQTYAIRRLVDNRIDTLDSIEVLQADIKQRWQTKRGYPGMQHIVDWMRLDLSGSYFPREDRDNFGAPFAFLEYDWIWNIGDRTALTSSGWYDPIENGPRVFTFGSYFNRTDRTNFYIGYRDIWPVDSRAVTGAVTYIFSPKYAFTASSTYDFGTGQSLSNSIVATRMGSDLQLSLGFTYNAMQNSFGVVFQIVPNLVPANRSLPGAGLLAGLGSPLVPGAR